MDLNNQTRRLGRLITPLHPQLYLAHPSGVIGTRWEARCLQVVARGWPRATLIDPITHFQSRSDWLRRWPLLLEHLDVLVAWPDPQGWIGSDTAREINEAVADGISAWIIADPWIGLPSGSKGPRMGLLHRGSPPQDRLERWVQVKPVEDRIGIGKSDA